MSDQAEGYFVVVVPDDHAPTVHRFDDAAGAAALLKGLATSLDPAARRARVYTFVGRRLLISRGERKFLLRHDGDPIPLFDQAVPGEPDEDGDLSSSGVDVGYRALTERLAEADAPPVAESGPAPLPPPQPSDDEDV